jgi:hypothetical protein
MVVTVKATPANHFDRAAYPFRLLAPHLAGP